MVSNGHIKLHRKILKWEWYSNVPTRILFLHCLLRANWKDCEWRGMEIKRGSFVSSRYKLASETGLTERQVRTAIEHLETTNELTRCSYPKFTVFTVVKYDEYQSIDQQNADKTPAKRPAKRQQSAGRTSTDEEEKKRRREEEKIKKPPHPGWEMIIPHNPQSILDHHPADGWVYEVIDGVEWAHKEKQKK